MPFNLFPILWRLLLLKINELLNFHYFFRNFTCNSPNIFVLCKLNFKPQKNARQKIQNALGYVAF